MPVTVAVNPATGAVSGPPATAALEWHRQQPGYLATPLHDLPELARALSLDRVWVKDETSRFGLPAFKMLGASWAARVALRLRRPTGVPVLVAATDGNHGQAVARVAAGLGCRARIFVPANTAAVRIAAIAAERAEVDAESADYDVAVARAAEFAAHPGAVLVSDTALEPGEPVPAAVVDGYATLFWEIGDALGPHRPDLVTVQIGSGGLAAAAARFFRAPGSGHPTLYGIEPTDAGCAFASIGQPAPTLISSAFDSVMVGLNVGRLSATAWPDVSAGFDAFTLIDDPWCRRAQRLLAQHGINAGETGSAGLAGLLALRAAAADCPGRPGLAPVAAARSALVIVTEGPTGASPA